MYRFLLALIFLGVMQAAHARGMQAETTTGKVVMVSMSTNSTPAYKTLEDQAADEAAWLIATWEHRPLLESDVDYVNGYFPSRDPAAWAAECDRLGNCKEGVVIGFGYSLPAHTPAEILRDLTPIVGEARARKMLPCQPYRGMEAYRRCHNSAELALTRDESLQLLRATRVVRDVAAVQALAQQKGIALGLNQLVALTSLHYTSPALVLNATKLWQAIEAGSSLDVWYEIARNSGSRRMPKLQPRRDAEAALFLQGWPPSQAATRVAVN